MADQEKEKKTEKKDDTQTVGGRGKKRTSGPVKQQASTPVK